MVKTYTCPKCGVENAAETPDSLCPKCLMELGLDTTALGGDDEADLLLAMEDPSDRYTYIGEKGKGGMGRVLLVNDERLGRDIALKELLPEGFGEDEKTPTPLRHSKEMAGRFLREARITGQLEHPSITPVHEIGRRPDGTLYYTMKLVRGQTLAAAINSARSLKDRLKLLPHFVDLCHAIAYAHSRNVIHRDIKPANVMVGDYGETVIVDWGLAKVQTSEGGYADKTERTVLAVRPDSLEGDALDTAQGQIMGTLAYSSPEQAEGEAEKVDQRSDVYSLGAVLYELLTGRTPHEGTTRAELLRRVVMEDPKPIQSIEKDVPDELVAVCTKALEKGPGDRYQSAGAFAEEVQRFLSGALVGAYQYSFGRHLLRWVGRNKAAAMALQAVLAMGLFTFLNVYQARNEERQMRVEAQTARSEAESQREEAQIAQAQEAQARHAEAEARAEAEENVVELTRASYVSAVRLAEHHVSRGEAGLARQRLFEAPAEYRGWEWGNLYQVLDRSKLTLTGGWKWGDHHQVLDRSKLTLSPSEVRRASYSPDGRRIVTASTGATKVWDAQTGEELLTLNGSDIASYSPDGRRIVTVRLDLAQVWDAQTGDELRTLTEGTMRMIGSVSYSPDSRRIVTSTIHDTTEVWDAETGEKLLTLDGSSASYSPNGRSIVTLSRMSSTANVWDAQTGGELRSVGELPPFNYSARHSPDSPHILCVYGRRVHVWNAQTGEELSTLLGHRTEVNSASFGYYGAIVTASDDGTAKVWKAQQALQGEELMLFGGGTGSVSYSPDGQRIVSAIWDGTVQVWDARTGEKLLSLTGHPDENVSASYSPDGRKIITASSDGTSKVWDAVTGEELRTLSGHGDDVASASYSPDGRRIVTTSMDGTAKIWDALTAQELRTLTLRGEGGISASYSPDGRRIVTGSWDGTSQVWDAETGEVLRTLSGHGDAVRFTSYSPDGRRIVTASDDYTAKVWDAETGEVLRTLTGHIDLVRSASYSPDGRKIITASSDSTTKVWDAMTGEELRTLGHPGGVSSASFSPDGRSVITLSGNIRVWGSAPWRGDDWRDDAMRGELLKLALRENPKPSILRFRSGTDESETQFHALAEMFSGWSDLGDSPNRSGVRDVPEQGVLLEDPAALPVVDGVDFQEGDLIVRIDTKPVDTLQGAAQIALASLQNYRDDPSAGLSLRIDVVNTYDRKVYLFDFHGIVE